MRRSRATRFFSAWLAVALLVVSGGAIAAPSDDFRAAEAAYRSGDMNGAVKILRGGSDAGHIPSMLLLAYIYEQASLDGQAVAMYRKAVAAGSADGEVGLAGMLAAGKGEPRDTGAALRLYESAAARGNPAAITALAQAYVSGTLGLTAGVRDDAKAVAAIRRAAEQGYAPAVEALARAYNEGNYGLTPDAAEAARWRDRRVAGAGAPRPAAGKAAP